MSSIERLLAIMAKLRDPHKGCPWDRQQTFASIVPHTLEEAYEVADTIERGAMGELKDELGDLLFQVVFYSQLARELGHFGFVDVVESIMAKLVRRHPHVFGDGKIADAEAQTAAWEAHKAEERQVKAGETATSMLDGVSLALPALTRALKLQRRAATVGFDWREIGAVLTAVEQELDELRHELSAANDERVLDEMGDLLFACVNLARFAKVDPETALRHSNAKFDRRFRFIEAALAASGRDIKEATLEEMDGLWQQAKSADG